MRNLFCALAIALGVLGLASKAHAADCAAYLQGSAVSSAGALNAQIQQDLIGGVPPNATLYLPCVHASIDQSTPGTSNAVYISQTTPGTSNGFQEVPAISTTGGYAFQVNSQPTVTASSYTTNQCVGGFNSVTVAGVNAQSGLLINMQVSSAAGISLPLTEYVFEANPAASTCTDHGTFTLNSADINKLIAGPSSVTAATPAGSSSTIVDNVYSVPHPFIAGGSGSSVKTIYYALVAGGGFVEAATSDVRVRIGVMMK